MPDLHRLFPPRPGRVHEACGPARTAFAAVLAALARGGAGGGAGGKERPILWIAERWQGARLNPRALADFIDPARLIMARVPSHDDGLAVAEEALRDGAVPLVVLEPSRPLGLTPGRRLQLAAKAGGTTGLCLIDEASGSNAAETRWRATPVFDPAAPEDSTPMRWDLIKNKSGTWAGIDASWIVRWQRTTHRLDVVSAPLLRAGAAGAPE